MSQAIAHVPFYRDWARSVGHVPGQPVDIADLPIVTKGDYTLDIERFQSDAFPVSDMFTNKTSGSSGEPFRFRAHGRAADASYCVLWRALHRFGLRPGDRRVYIWGRSYAFNASPLNVAKHRARQTLRNWLNNTLSVDAYSLTHENVERTIQRIEAFRPRYLHGYVSALYTIARTLNDRGRTLNTPGLVAAVTESEKLYRFQRKAMEQAFECPILEHYGSVELGNIAQPDPDGNMRINEDLYIVERLPTGEAAITNLMTHAYPFIRYRLGDLIERRDTIPPGLPYACLKSVVGRTVDMIPLASGGLVHGVALAHLIDPHLDHVLKYQIRQTALERFAVTLVPRHEGIPPPVLDTIARDLRSLTGATTRIDFTTAPHITPAQSGKFRWVVSDLTVPAHGSAGPDDDDHPDEKSPDSASRGLESNAVG